MWRLNMSKEERENIKSSVLPFEVERGYTAMPNAVSDYYTLHPRFTGATERLYLFLLRMYNAEKGYAYPGYKAIKERTKISSDETVANAIKSLEHLGLIRVEQIRLGNGNKSNRYYFDRPIESYEEFMRRFGEELPKKYRDIPVDIIVDNDENNNGFDDLGEWF